MVKKMFLVCFVLMMCTSSVFAAGTAFDFKRAVPRGFGKDLARAMMVVDSNKKRYPPGQTPPLEFLDTLNKAFEMIGLNYSGSIEKTLGGASGQSLMQLRAKGIMDILYLPVEHIANEGLLHEAIKKGLLTNQAATAIYEAAKVMERPRNWKVPTPAPATSPSLEKYLGEYTYLGDTCSGGLNFSRTGKSRYMMSVEIGCESGGTCGDDFEVTPSSEGNGVVTLANAEYGITFTVSAKGIAVDNVPTGMCGMGAYMHGEYVKGKTAAKAQEHGGEQGISTTDSATVCGQISKMRELPGRIGQFVATDMDENSGRYYFVLDEDMCTDLVKDEGFICFDVQKTEKNTLGMESFGVKEKTLRWIGNCRTPG